MKFFAYCTLFFSSLCLIPGNALAWHCDGHNAIAREAILLIKDSVPDFFYNSRIAIMKNSCEPDLFKIHETPQLRTTESPEHYFDFELLLDTNLPKTREGFIAMYDKSDIVPSSIGFLPYTISEYTQRLMIVFAEHRKWPADKDVQAKVALYAGLLSHYAADLCQPLHLTIHYDGRIIKPGQQSPHSGIHEKVDALAGKINIGRINVKSIAVFTDLTSAIHEELDKSRQLINHVYEMESSIPTISERIEDNTAIAAFAAERFRSSILFLASLYLTAWTDSRKIQIPEWYSTPESNNSSPKNKK